MDDRQREAVEKYYPANLPQAVIDAREQIAEWDYEKDPHGYCHDRPYLLAMVEEIERLRPDVADAVRRYFGEGAWPRG